MLSTHALFSLYVFMDFINLCLCIHGFQVACFLLHLLPTKLDLQADVFCTNFITKICHLTIFENIYYNNTHGFIILSNNFLNKMTYYTMLRRHVVNYKM